MWRYDEDVVVSVRHCAGRARILAMRRWWRRRRVLSGHVVLVRSSVNVGRRYARQRSWEVWMLSNRRLRRGRGICAVGRALGSRRVYCVAVSVTRSRNRGLNGSLVEVRSLRQGEGLLMLMLFCGRPKFAVSRNETPKLLALTADPAPKKVCAAPRGWW